MKKGFLLLCAAMICAMAGAQVVKGTERTGAYFRSNGTLTTVHGLDFNNDDTCEFELAGYADLDLDFFYPNGAVGYVYSSSNNIVTYSTSTGTFANLSLGDDVNVTSTFNGQGDGFFYEYTGFDSGVYVGFRIKYASAIHYGYARVTIDTTQGDASSTYLKWDIYHNATPSGAITVGDVENPLPLGIDNGEVNHFIAAAMEGHQLNIVQEKEDVIDIYTMNGMKVESVTGTNVIVTLPSAGVYILRSATSSARISVR